MHQKNVLTAAILSVACLGLSAAAQAAYPDFYAGAQAGLSDTNYNRVPAWVQLTPGDNVTAKPHTRGFSGRVFIGSQFSPNWAAEFGFTPYSRTVWHHLNANDANGSIEEHAYDLVGKAIVPFDNGFSVYAKGGVAYIRANTSGDFVSHADGVNPTYGLGFEYQPIQQMSTFIDWSRVQNNKRIPNADRLSIGAAYHFG